MRLLAIIKSWLSSDISDLSREKVSFASSVGIDIDNIESAYLGTVKLELIEFKEMLHSLDSCSRREDDCCGWSCHTLTLYMMEGGRREFLLVKGGNTISDRTYLYQNGINLVNMLSVLDQVAFGALEAANREYTQR